MLEELNDIEDEDALDENVDQDALFEHFVFEVSNGQNPIRIDKYLVNLLENYSRSKIQNALQDKHIYVNDQYVTANYKVKPKDTISLKFPHPTYAALLVPEDIPLNIVYEDDELLVINKPAGFVVHPGHGNYSGTLVNALIYHFKNLPINNSNGPGLVHRIDKDTTGLLVVAKTEIAMKSLAKQFAKKTTQREYVALVWGDVEQDEGTIEGYIARNPKNRLQMYSFQDETMGKHAITHYKVIERFGYVTLVSCILETGRTHQIRVHMKYLGHILFNDERYGGHKILKGTTFAKYTQFVKNCFETLPRQALHAKTLGFEHPVTKEFLQFNSEIPQDMQQCIEKWRHYVKHEVDEEE
jgi:23S rRNA pseudouridine1911/1915/1917 synthase